MMLACRVLPGRPPRGVTWTRRGNRRVRRGCGHLPGHSRRPRCWNTASLPPPTACGGRQQADVTRRRDSWPGLFAVGQEGFLPYLPGRVRMRVEVCEADVPMRDGLRLRADVTTVPEAGPRPALLIR